MTETRTPMQGPQAQRRRFLRGLGLLLGGLGAAAWMRRIDPPPAPPRDLALREADFYRPHDLAG